MIKTLYETKYDEGVAVGKAENVAGAKADTVLTFLRAKFKRIPKGIEKSIRQMSDPIALDSLAAHIVNCESLDEFAKELR